MQNRRKLSLTEPDGNDFADIGYIQFEESENAVNDTYFAFIEIRKQLNLESESKYSNFQL